MTSETNPWLQALRLLRWPAVAIAVSEETGHISVAFEGTIERNLDIKEFGARLNELMFDEDYQTEEPEADEDDSPA